MKREKSVTSRLDASAVLMVQFDVDHVDIKLDWLTQIKEGNHLPVTENKDESFVKTG